MANGEALEHVKVPIGKNGGTKVPLTVIAIFAGLLVYVTTEIVKVAMPRATGSTIKTENIVKALEDINKTQKEVSRQQMDLLQNMNVQTRINAGAVERTESSLQEHRRIME